MPDFKGHSQIILQPNDLKRGFIFKITICSSKTANNGNIPYGTTISSITVTGMTEAGVTDTELLYSSSLSGQEILVQLSYPSTNGTGQYKLQFILVLSNGEERELDFNKITCKDK